MGKRKFWTDSEIEQLRQLYPSHSTAAIAPQFGGGVSRVYQMAAKLGLKKSPEYLASPEACRLRRGDEVGKPFRFKKGQAPPNKGLRRPGWAPGRMSETQFKAGQVSNTYMPIGSERVNKDGYLERKFTDVHGTPRDWRRVHILVWEEANGPLPAGHAIVFIDRDKNNRELSNLDCITRAELMLRNSSQRWGPEVFAAIQLRGALNRKIRSLNEKQNV